MWLVENYKFKFHILHANRLSVYFSITCKYRGKQLISQCFMYCVLIKIFTHLKIMLSYIFIRLRPTQLFISRRTHQILAAMKTDNGNNK